MKPFSTVDLSRADAKLVDAVCRDTGFLAIVGHGFPEDVLEAAWRAARAFFDLPRAVKMGVAMPYAGYPYGYAPLCEEALARSLGDTTPPDLKETFSIGPEATWSGGKHAPLWPKEPTELEAVLRRYFQEMGRLAARVMAVFATALELPSDFFASKIDQHASALRILNYPALEAEPLPGQLRAGAHSDYGSLTIVFAEPGSRGLQIRSLDGTWREVPIQKGAFIVNVGDLLARWSNDRWVSTVHRVVCEPEPRQSMAFFHLPNWDAEIACIPGEPARYEPVTAGKHLMSKFERAVKI